MKKIIVLLLAIAGIFLFFRYYESEPPKPIVTVAGESIEVRQGAYCWSPLFISAECASKPYTSGFDAGTSVDPVPVSPGTEVTFNFQTEPKEEKINTYLWFNEEESQEIQPTNRTLTVPDERGIYAYEIIAEWRRGNGNFAFSVEVE